jgi:rhodanese-related sulfurtransferase
VIADEAVLRALENPTFIDVRGPGEVEAKPGPAGATNVTWDTSTCTFFDPSLLPVDKTNPVVVFWGVGGRASKAKVFLEESGYGAVYNGGGFDRVKEIFGL